MEDPEYYVQLCSRLTLQNQQLGFFKDLINKVAPFISLAEFSRCSSDLERVLCCSSYCWNLIGAELVFRCKNNEEAVEKRLQGNVSFSIGEFDKALLLFSQSIIKSPPGKDLALTYANRSAVLQKLKEWQFAIADIELAFSYDYPQETRHKLYERMAACDVKLKNYAHAKIVIGLCKHYLTKYSVPDGKQYEEKLAKHLKNIEKGANEVTKETPAVNSKQTEKGTSPANPKFPGASTKFDVKHSPEKGRFVTASDDVHAGELVLEEEPYAKVLLLERMETHCLHCFKKLRAAIACEICANVAFCSKTCRQNADKYHRYECRVFSLLIGSGMSILPHLALRMITQSSAEELVSKSEKLMSKPEEIILEGSAYDPTNFETVYNLSALEFQRAPQDFLERTIMTIFLIKCLRLVGYFEINLFKNPGPTQIEMQTGALLLRNLQILQFNAYEIAEYTLDNNNNFRKAQTRHIGLGLYPTAAFFNHSCSPNVTRYFNGTKITIISTEKIQAGQAIQDNYGPLFTKMTRKERQYKLHGRYWFSCACEACQHDWPTYEGMGDQILPKDEEEKNKMTKLQKLDDLFYDDGLKSMVIGKGEAAVESLSKYLNESDSLISSIPSVKPYKTFYLAKDALQLCLPALNKN